MNWLDIILIIIIIIVFIVGLFLSILCWIDSEIALGFGALLSLMFINFLFIIPFIVLDRGSGSTIGTITSVDKNFFGTTAIYIKSSENQQEEYCIENEELVKKANEYIGKKVKVTYGERVGLYSTGKCSQAPIDKLEIIDAEG